MSKYRSYFTDKGFLLSVLLGMLALGVSLIVSTIAINYATRTASNSVTDIVLSNTRFYDVDGLFVYGALVLVVLIVIVMLAKPQSLPFALKSMALFFLTRAIFLSLTHISPFPMHIAIAPSFFTTSPLFRAFFTGDDLFFSGHTGLPFLMALVFWDTRPLRFLFIALALFFG